MRSQGMTYDAIAKYLNDEKILVPRLYFKYNKLKDDDIMPEMNIWTRTILNKMVNNEQYTGKLIFGRYKVDKIRGKTSTRTPHDEWIITENAHDAIVSGIRELKKKQKAVLVKKNEKEINVKVYKEIGEIKKIDRRVVEKFIDKIIVNREGRVEIQWTFKEIFQSA